MNYPPNEIDWDLGDIVLHDADAKEPRMLMVVVGKMQVLLSVTYLTVYLDQCDPMRKHRITVSSRDKQPKCPIWLNAKDVLHDPSQWLGDEWKEISFDTLKDCFPRLQEKKMLDHTPPCSHDWYFSHTLQNAKCRLCRSTGAGILPAPPDGAHACLGCGHRVGWTGHLDCTEVRYAYP